MSLEIGSEGLGYFANVASVGSESQLQTEQVRVLLTT